MIPAEAIEAAACAIYQERTGMGWESRSEALKETVRGDARAALEAAAQHMLAEAWEEGRRSYRDDLAGTPRFGTPGYKETPNPYRPTE